MERTRSRFGLLAATLLALCLAAAFLMTGCTNDTENVRKAIDQQFDLSTQTEALTEGINESAGSSLELLGIDSAELVGKITEKYSYSVDNIKVDGKTATADLTITFLDMNQVSALMDEKMEAYTSTLTTLDFTAIYQEMGRELMESMSDPSVGTVSTNIPISLTKDGNTWSIDNLDSIQQQMSSNLFGGI